MPHFLKQLGGRRVRSIILAWFPLCRHMTGSSSSTDQEGLIQPTNLSVSFVLLLFSPLRSVVEYWRGQAKESNSHAGQARQRGEREMGREKPRDVLRENEQPAVEELVRRRRMGVRICQAGLSNESLEIPSVNGLGLTGPQTCHVEPWQGLGIACSPT